MEKKFEVTIKDLVFIITIMLTAAGSWYSQATRLREIEIRIEAQKTIDAMSEKVLEAKVAELSSKLDNYWGDAKFRKK